MLSSYEEMDVTNAMIACHIMNHTCARMNLIRHCNHWQLSNCHDLQPACLDHSNSCRTVCRSMLLQTRSQRTERPALPQTQKHCRLMQSTSISCSMDVPLIRDEMAFRKAEVLTCCALEAALIYAGASCRARPEPGARRGTSLNEACWVIIGAENGCC